LYKGIFGKFSYFDDDRIPRATQAIAPRASLHFKLYTSALFPMNSIQAGSPETSNKFDIQPYPFDIGFVFFSEASTLPGKKGALHDQNSPTIPRQPG
jgi:hypothetical protein